VLKLDNDFQEALKRYLDYNNLALVDKQEAQNIAAIRQLLKPSGKMKQPESNHPETA
jgi:hypothetical protein